MLSAIKKGFGWNWRSWSHPVLKSQILSEKLSSGRKLTVLEIGAGQLSILSTMFYLVATKIDVGAFGPENVGALRAMIEKNEYLSDVPEVNVKHVDIFNIEGKYDVIIMKSVLGGVFRSPTSINSMNEVIKGISEKNLRSDGCLITIDNGRSSFEYFLRNIGSRRNNWNYFEKSSFWDTDEQHGFGVLSVGSFSSRFGIFGSICDFLIFCADLILFQFWKFKPTIICSIWKNRN